MLRRTVLASGLGGVVAAIVARTAEAGPAFGEPPTIALTPELPTSSDSMVVTATLEASDLCTMFKAYDLRVDELKRIIRLDLRYVRVNAICAQVIQTIAREIPLPKLVPGDWTLEVRSKLNHKKFPNEMIPFTVVAATGV